MIVKRLPTKDPNEVLDYYVLYTDSTGDTITNAVWDIPAGLTKVSDSFTGVRATVWLSGGVSGQEYFFTAHLTTAAGRALDQSFRLFVEQQ